MNKKKIIGLVLAGSILTVGFASNNSMKGDDAFKSSWKLGKENTVSYEDENTDDSYYDEDQMMKEIMDEFREKLSKEEYSKVEKLFGEIEKLEEQEALLDEKYDDLYMQLEEIAEKNEIDFDSGDDGYMEEESETIASYDVNKGKVDFEKFKEDIKDHKKIWEKTIKLYPNEYIERIANFNIESDGVDGIMASVSPLEDGNSKFVLAVDPEDALDSSGKIIKELDHTLVHELAHIVTLNEKQLDYSNGEEVSSRGKDTLVIEEGVTKKASYLNKFYNEFWTDIHKEVKKIEKLAEESPEKAEEMSYEFYEKHENQFVSDYAATNPVEDIAESFTHFVKEEKPSGNLIKDKKVLFFYQFDELVKLRDQLRKNLK